MTKPKKLKLTKFERNLLLFPPTEESWICPGSEEGFLHLNGKAQKHCLWCGAKKPRRPKKLYPQYVAACAKVGIEPGWQWMTRADGTAVMRTRKGSWRNVPVEHG